MFGNEKNWRIFNTFEKRCIYNYMRYNKKSADKKGEEQISEKLCQFNKNLKRPIQTDKWISFQISMNKFLPHGQNAQMNTYFFQA